MRNIIKRIITFLLSLILITGITPASVYAGTPKIPSNITVEVGETVKINADLSECNSKQKRWSISNSSVATITSIGKVTGISPGSVSAYCTTSYGEVAICTVNVIEKTKPRTTKRQTTKRKTTRKRTTKKNTTKRVVKTTKKPTTKQYTTAPNQTSKNNAYFVTTKQEKGSSKKSNNTATTSGVVTKPPFSLVNESTIKMSTTTTNPSIKSTQKVTHTKRVVLVDENTKSNNENKSEDNYDVEIDSDSSYELVAVSKKKNPIAIQWNKIDGATGYELYCGTSQSGNMTLIYDGNINSYKKHFFENGNLYYFAVHAYKINENGEKEYFAFSETIKIQAVNKSLFTKIKEIFRKE